MKKISLLLFLSLMVFNSFGQSSFRALPWSHNLAYNSYLLRDVHGQFADRYTEINQAFTSKASMQKYVDDCKVRYKEIIGEFPERTDNLNAKIVETIDAGPFIVEKIVFESLPNRYVTTHLYLPKGYEKPYAAAIEVCGHGINGKGAASGSAIAMVVNGIAVMVVDPIGQGERLQLIDEEGKALTRGATTEHTLLNTGYNLLGTSLAAQEFWDNSRAVDYLMSRPDIDENKIGVYGSSGGGTQTAYYVGLDERVKVAAICSFFSTRERTIETQGPSDGCQHVPYEGLKHIEVTDLALMMAPRPMLILSGKYDFVDLWGAKQGFNELKRAYTALGVPEKVDMLTVETGHGLGLEKIDKLISWFKLYLNNDKSANKPVPAYSLPSYSKMICSSKGQVNISFDDAVSVMRENTITMDELAVNREKFLKSNSKEVKSKITELLGIGTLDSEIRPELTGHYSQRGFEQYNYQIIREGEMPVPCIVLVPETATKNSRISLRLMEEGQSNYLNESTNFAQAITDGTIVVTADLRGFGETSDPAQYNDAKYWNKEYRNAMISMHIGRPIIGQRVVDIMTLVDFCSKNEMLKGHSVDILAKGNTYGCAVIHATYLDNRIKSASITQCIKTYRDYLSNPLQRDMYSNVVYGALKYYDLPDLIRLSNARARITD